MTEQQVSESILARADCYTLIAGSSALVIMGFRSDCELPPTRAADQELFCLAFSSESEEDLPRKWFMVGFSTQCRHLLEA